MGSKKARVFPDPVFATPITSRPHIIAGIACHNMDHIEVLQFEEWDGDAPAFGLEMDR